LSPSVCGFNLFLGEYVDGEVGIADGFENFDVASFLG